MKVRVRLVFEAGKWIVQEKRILFWKTVSKPQFHRNQDEAIKKLWHVHHSYYYENR